MIISILLILTCSKNTDFKDIEGYNEIIFVSEVSSNMEMSFKIKKTAYYKIQIRFDISKDIIIGRKIYDTFYQGETSISVASLLLIFTKILTRDTVKA
jgi:hypothetical protein